MEFELSQYWFSEFWPQDATPSAIYGFGKLSRMLDIFLDKLSKRPLIPINLAPSKSSNKSSLIIPFPTLLGHITDKTHQHLL